MVTASELVILEPSSGVITAAPSVPGVPLSAGVATAPSVTVSERADAPTDVELEDEPQGGSTGLAEVAEARAEVAEARAEVAEVNAEVVAPWLMELAMGMRSGESSAPSSREARLLMPCT
jgi:hypothetical protein